MKLSLGLLAGFGLLLINAPSAEAGGNPNASVLVHLATPLTKAPCTTPNARPDCLQAVTQGQLYPATYYAYVLVGNASASAGVSGVEFGINYDGVPHVGVDVFAWNSCGDGQLPTANWPAPGSGNTVFWNSSNCQRFEPAGAGTGVVTAAGYFYCAAYSSDRLNIVPNSDSHRVATIDCSGAVDTIYYHPSCVPANRLGFAGFGTDYGFNPCLYLGESECGMIGPATVAAGTTGVIYGNDVLYWYCTSLDWTIEGNATITGSPDPYHVTVNVGGGVGPFILHHRCWLPGPHGGYAQCCKVVQVTGGVAAAPVDASPPRPTNELTALPNPTRGPTGLHFTLESRNETLLSVYDLHGSEVTSIRLGVLEAGPNTIEWDGLDSARHEVPSGIYFLRLRSGALELRGRLLVVR